MNSTSAPEKISNALSGNANGASGTCVSEIKPMIKGLSRSLPEGDAHVLLTDDYS